MGIRQAVEGIHPDELGAETSVEEAVRDLLDCAPFDSAVPYTQAMMERDVKVLAHEADLTTTARPRRRRRRESLLAALVSDPVNDLTGLPPRAEPVVPVENGYFRLPLSGLHIRHDGSYGAKIHPDNPLRIYGTSPRFGREGAPDYFGDIPSGRKNLSTHFLWGALTPEEIKALRYHVLQICGSADPTFVGEVADAFVSMDNILPEHRVQLGDQVHPGSPFRNYDDIIGFLGYRLFGSGTERWNSFRDEYGFDEGVTHSPGDSLCLPIKTF